MRKNKKNSPTSPQSVSAADQAQAALLKQRAMAAKVAGNSLDEVKFLTESLKLDSAQADIHFSIAMLARTKPELKISMDAINHGIRNRAALRHSYEGITTLLKSRTQYSEAVLCYEEICRLYPHNLDEKANLAIIQNIANLKTEAVRNFAECVCKEPSNKIYKGLFASSCGTVNFDRYEPQVKKALQISFDNIYECNLAKAYSPWMNILLHDPDCSGIKSAEKITTDDDFFIWIKSDDKAKKKFLTEKFFLDGLRLLIIGDPVLERFLIRIRQWLCINFVSLRKENKLNFYKPFLMALAEQCFFNEYLYPVSSAEEHALLHLKSESFSRETPDDYLSSLLAIMGCYEALHTTFKNTPEIIDRASTAEKKVSSLLKTQYHDHIREQEIKKSLQKFGSLTNSISLNVQAQYEENPYPRWTSVTNYPTPNDDIPFAENLRANEWNILIAGCGTGRQAIGCAATYPNAKITAIDLSTASLGYAVRKAEESGLADRINFTHADILSMKDWPDFFDIIECSGVLHHMEDPMAGWKTLVDKLKPGGFFKVGLYSEIARRRIVEAREYVVKNEFPSTNSGIRDCRESILLLPRNNPMRSYLLSSGDFYATSLIRDLIFHVQEHRLTLPQIKLMLEKLNLSCTSFTISDAATIKKYDKMFPGDCKRNDLDNWHAIEEKFPDTFAGMYQFWSKKNAN